MIGSVYVYNKDTGNTWTQVHILVASDGAADQGFGYSVSLHNHSIVVGAYFNSAPGGDAGVFYRRVYERAIENV